MSRQYIKIKREICSEKVSTEKHSEKPVGKPDRASD